MENCKRGDILREVELVHEQVAKAIESGEATIHAKLAKEGLIGCGSLMAR